jgi:predicted MFS family arabinose efflux permease
MIPAAFVFLPLRMNELGASNTLTGVAIAATGFFSILFYSKIGKFCDRFDLSGLYCVMLVSVALRTVLISLPSVDPRWFLVIQIMEVPTWLLRDVLRIKYLDSFVSEERRPKTQALIALVSYSGSAVCAAAASGLLQVVSLQQMFVYHAFIPLLGLPFAIYLWKLGFKR